MTSSKLLTQGTQLLDDVLQTLNLRAHLPDDVQQTLNLRAHLPDDIQQTPNLKHISRMTSSKFSI